mgnify:CR=1 FL=1
MNNKFTKVLPLCVAAFLALPFVTEHAYAAEKDIKVSTPVSETQANVFAEGTGGASSTDGTEIKDYESASKNGLTKEQKEKIEYVKVGEQVKTIGKYALAGMEALKEVDLPKSLEQVKDHAFEGCDKLSKVKYQGTEKQWEAVEIGHEGNEPLKNAKVEALKIGAEEIEVTTKDPVVGVDPEGKATSSVSSPKFTVEDMWRAEDGKVKSSSARWNGELDTTEELFDKFEDGVEYSHSIRLTIPKALADKGYKFDEAAFTGDNVKIKVDGRNVEGAVSLNPEKTVATFTDLISGVLAVPASQDTTGEGKDPKPEEAKKAEAAKKAQAAKKEASNSEFYKTGDASVLPLISTMLTSGLAAFASRKKKD